jgi:hypothetical protein
MLRIRKKCNKCSGAKTSIYGKYKLLNIAYIPAILGRHIFDWGEIGVYALYIYYLYEWNVAFN